jgi:vacuolar protein sorting-associated protein 52
MWLDRLSGHSTPSGTPPPSGNRHPSPSQRLSRTSSSQGFRSSLHPRSSSTSLLLSPNDSSASLPTTARNVSNGAPQKPVFSRTPPGEVTGPLEVLNGIIGKKLSDQLEADSAGKPAQLVEDIDFEDLSLEEFANRGKQSGGLLSSEDGVGTIEQCRYIITFLTSLS